METARPPLGRALPALALAHLRYWSAVAPLVDAELVRWRGRAETIPDPLLRTCAIEKLRDARSHAEVTATLATIAPRQHRARVTEAIVALEVMYDYLDAVSERATTAERREVSSLFGALPAIFAEGEHEPHPHGDRHGDYLQSLAQAARAAVWSLPSTHIVAPTAHRVALLCGEAQTRSHAVPSLGPGQLEAWAKAVRQRSSDALAWWEVAAGFAASILTVHALVAIAAHNKTTITDAHQIAATYHPLSSLATMLDSLIDRDRDQTSGDHSYVSYYPSDIAIAEGLIAIAHQALRHARHLRHAPHHQITVAGVAAFYLSTSEASSPAVQSIAAALLAQLQPCVTPIIAAFRVWRKAHSQESSRCGR